MDNVQDELDSLKDLLRGDGYSLDANTLLGVSFLQNEIENDSITTSNVLTNDENSHNDRNEIINTLLFSLFKSNSDDNNDEN